MALEPQDAGGIVGYYLGDPYVDGILVPCPGTSRIIESIERVWAFVGDPPPMWVYRPKRERCPHDHSPDQDAARDGEHRIGNGNGQ